MLKKGPTLMRRTGLILAMVLILVCGSALNGSAAEEVSVRISAARSGWYDAVQKRFVGEGDVQIATEDTLITGDYVEWSIDTGELVVSGNVVLKQGENELAGEYLFYSVNRGEGEFLDVSALVEAPKAEGPIFLRSETVVISRDGTYRLLNGRITTCDLEKPHYYLAVKELELFPNDKLIVRNVTYYEGSIPLFYWPYLILPVGENIADMLSLLPVVGYSNNEGFYVKTNFDYYLNENHYGVVHLDLYSKLGVGYGFTHNYSHSWLGKGKLRAFHIPFGDQGKFSANFNHEWSQGPWRFVTTNALDTAGNDRKADLRSRLTLTTASVSASLNGTYQENLGSSTGKAWEYGASWRQQLAEGLRLTLNGSVTGKEGSKSLRMLDYLAETTYTKGSHTLALAVEQKYNPDLLEEGAQPTWSSLNRMPELSWRLTNPRLSRRVLPIQLELKGGHYHEFPSDVADWRLGGTAALLTRTWRPTQTTTISYGGEAASAWYGEGGNQSVLTGRLNLTQQLGSRLRLTARYNEQLVFGESPFRFDKKSPVRSVNLSLSHTSSALSLSASTSYNFLTEKYGTLALQGTWRPTANLKLSLSAGYDLNTDKWGRIVPKFEYSAKDGQERTKTFRLGGKYDVGAGQWEEVEVQVKSPVGETWTIGYDAVYEPKQEDFRSGQIRIDKEFHCRSITLAYDHVKGNVAFSVTINAFPTLPFGWDSDKGVSLFDVDDVLDLIGVEK